MLNPIAEKLIHDLRYDAHTREHFSISSWTGRGTCNTVGCIAGTAILMSLGDKYLDDPAEIRFHMSGAGSYIAAGARILGIAEHQTAKDLFLPWEAADSILKFGPAHFDYLPTQARPDLSTVARMKVWARKRLYTDHTPDRCALALERIVRDEIPYCDWAYAMENV